MRRILPVILLALALNGCAQISQVRDLIGAATTTIVNPVDSIDIYRVKNAGAVVKEAAVQWRRLCWSKPYAELMKEPIAKALCKNRRPALRAIQDYNGKMNLAIFEAESFVQQNPTLSAATAIQAAWDAITRYRNAIPK